jgi:membrane protease YdiL (CAAX protease family)
MPPHLLGELELTPILIAFILIGAPIGEELLFRSWLSGRPGHVGAIIVVLATAIAMAVALGNPLAVAGVLVVGLALMAFVLWRKRGRPPMPFFARHFRWFYLLSAFAFAGVHLTNFTEGTALFLLPLTLPQFVLGLILGFVRVQYGMWANMLLHAAHNSLFVGLMLAGAG